MNRTILLVATSILLTFGLAPIHAAVPVNYTTAQRYVEGIVIPPQSLGTNTLDQTFALTAWNGSHTTIDGAGSAGGTQDSSLIDIGVNMTGQLATSIPAG